MKLIPRISKFKGGPLFFKQYGIDSNKFISQALKDRGLSNLVAFEITWQSVPKGFYSFGSRFNNADDWADNVVNHLLNRNIYKNARDATTFDEYRKATFPYNTYPWYTDWLRKGRGKEFINLYINENNLGKPVAVMNFNNEQILTAKLGGIIKALTGTLVSTYKMYGWEYDPTTKKWTRGNESYGSFYTRTKDGQRLHFDTTGSVSSVNKYNYVGKAATGERNDPEGIKALKQHLRAEIKNQKLVPKSGTYSRKQIKFKNDLRAALLAEGFTENQTAALLMNAADETGFAGPDISLSNGGAKGIWQLDGARRARFEREYNKKGGYTIENQVEFLKREIDERSKLDDTVLHLYEWRNDPENDSLRVVDPYGNVPRFESPINPDSIPSYDRELRGRYVDKINTRKKGNTLRYVGLPLNYYIKIFNSPSNVEYSPEELSFMFAAGFEKAGRPSGRRLNASIYNQ